MEAMDKAGIDISEAKNKLLIMKEELKRGDRNEAFEEDVASTTDKAAQRREEGKKNRKEPIKLLNDSANAFLTGKK